MVRVLENETCNSRLRVRIVQPEKVCAKERSYWSSAVSYMYNINKFEPHAQKCRVIEQEPKVISCNKGNTNVRKTKPKQDSSCMDCQTPE